MNTVRKQDFQSLFMKIFIEKLRSAHIIDAQF